MYEKVKKICKENNITVLELEEKLGFSRSSLCKWNTNIPSVAKVKLVADFFGMTVDELIDDKG